MCDKSAEGMGINCIALFAFFHLWSGVAWNPACVSVRIRRIVVHAVLGRLEIISRRGSGILFAVASSF